MFTVSFKSTLLVLMAAASVAQVGTSNLLKFHARTPDQQIEAQFFDDPNSRPLQPNVTRTEEFEQAAPPHKMPDYSAYLRDTVCAADLVALGRTVSQQSFVTGHESTIFTEYQFAVDEWLRGSVVFDRPQGVTTITVALKGGRIDTDAGPIVVENEDPLTPNRQYIVFLKRIPNTSSYHLTAPTLVAASVGTSMKTHRDVPDALRYGDKPTPSLLADIRRSAGSCGGRGGAR